jgi:acyl-CoA thioester hydrolase
MVKHSPLEIRIYYEDTDCGGVVYYANYFRYFERARTEFLRQKGVSVTELASEGIHFVVNEAQIKYLAPARYDDVLLVNTTIAEAGGASFVMSHTVVDKNTGRLIVKGTARLVCVKTDTGKPVRLPDVLKYAFEFVEIS